MNFDVLTIFPQLIEFYIKESIIKRAIDKELISVSITNIRDFTHDKHKSVDDAPYGGDRPFKMGEGVKIENLLTYGYKTIDIKDINCAELLQSDQADDIVLAVLCGSEEPEKTVTSIVKSFLPLPEQNRRDYILKLLTLSKLRKLDVTVMKEVKKILPIRIYLTEEDEHIRAYLDGIEEGKAKGRAEGIADGIEEGKAKGRAEGINEGRAEGIAKGIDRGKREGLLEGIEALMDVKFGSDGLSLFKNVKQIKSIEKLEAFKELIRRAKLIDELKEFLEDMPI
ncbi:tRNA (guanine-N1-)-methyltransferase [Candidatus Magnetoovum chiemensis]|nr:tRNA (guanine-N1-)-methyltransferase [Candidatus Magnetoovum chiemensis]